MSLKDLAQQMKATGRKGDTELVHMTKREVAGLQALAEAAGGTLTINPKTGLPEASWLDAIVAPLVGLGVGFMTMNPYAGAAAGAAVGGAQAASNDQNVLLGAGLGAVGGLGAGGFGSSLAGAGAGAAQAGAMTSASELAAQSVGQGLSAAPGAVGANLVAPSAQGLAATTGSGLNLAAPAAQGAQYGVAAPELVGETAARNMLAGQATTDYLAQPFIDQAGQGIGALGTEAGRATFMEGIGGIGGLAKSGAMAASPALLGGLMPRGGATEAPTEEEDNEDLFGRYEYVANPIPGGRRAAGAPLTSEATYFDGFYRPRFMAAQGGTVKKFADGGEASASSSEFDPARGMTGMSRDAMMYLYGMAPTSRSGEVPEGYVAPNVQFQPARASRAPAVVGGDGGAYYFVDPSTFNFSSGNWDSNPQPYSGPSFDYGFAEGGLASLAKGGMKAGGFVVPADIVSFVGEGNTDAGYERIKEMLPGAVPIKGKDGGQADTVKTSIEGKQPARIAHGEMYVPPKTVEGAGGAKKLYAMMDKVRKQATGNKKQIKPVNLKKALA